MRTFFKDLISADNWLIHENGFDPKKINVYESLFTLGNGYMGSRGVLEEIPYDSSSGTYIAGVYDKSISQVPELVNVPNPIDLRIVAEGEKIDIKGMYLHKHQRVLDMKNGLLFRHSILANSRRERFDYKSVRFISHHNKHIGVMRITVTPLDAPAILTVQDNINVSIRNKGVLTEGRKKHFQIREVRSERSINYVCARTQDTGISIACATHLIIASKDESSPAPDQSFDIRLKKGESLTLTKFFYLRTSRHLSRQRLRDSSIKALKKVVRSGFDGMVKRQQAALNKLWKYADVRIEGDSDAQRSLRFNIYHLLISGNPYDDDVSIGAKTLSGEGYRGHIFWDTEVFILPFFIYNFPSIARNLLLYRYHRLEAARRRAKERGYKGVLFPWESADTGEDATPQWHKDLDGSIIPISTQDYEHHIVADIAYGIYHYYQATGDSKFMNAYGAEMIFEAARFWASRVKENKRLRKYVINNVMGPDEFHADVNNNAYTNVMAGWNLEMAANLYYEIKSKYPKQLKGVVRKLKLKESEPRKWKHISGKIYVPFDKKKKVIESFDGYFKKRDIEITMLDKHFMPEFPPGLPLSGLKATQIIKQLDATMIFYLLPDAFDEEIEKDTISYYEKRTVHKSSLSPAINAVMNLRSGNTTRAYQYFLFALNADLKGNQSNVSDGVHAASLGGCWQAAINGFSGMRIRGGMLSFEPLFPEYWRSLEFYIHFQGDLLKLHITHKTFTLWLESSRNKQPLKLEIFGKEYAVLPRRKLVVKTNKE